MVLVLRTGTKTFRYINSFNHILSTVRNSFQCHTQVPQNQSNRTSERFLPVSLPLPFPKREMSGGLVECVRWHNTSLSQHSLFTPHMETYLYPKPARLLTLQENCLGKLPFPAASRCQNRGSGFAPRTGYSLADSRAVNRLWLQAYLGTCHMFVLLCDPPWLPRAPKSFFHPMTFTHF